MILTVRPVAFTPANSPFCVAVSIERTTTTLFSERYIGLARAGHPALAELVGEAMPLAVFVAHPHALVNVLGGRLGAVDEALATLGFRREIRLWLPYFSTAAAIVARRDLLLTLPMRAAAALAPANGLRRFTLPVEIESFSYRLLWRPRSHADSGAAWMRTAIAEASKAPDVASAAAESDGFTGT